MNRMIEASLAAAGRTGVKATFEGSGRRLRNGEFAAAREALPQPAGRRIGSGARRRRSGGDLFSRPRRPFYRRVEDFRLHRLADEVVHAD